jgi:crossover junction endodeoxyribonuclease RuvC
MNHILGVDPGKTGAVAIVSTNGAQCEVWDMPTTEADYLDLEEEITCLYGLPKAIYLESVHAMPGQGVTSMFSFGVSFGQARLFCALFKVRWVLVTPQKWKGALSLGRDKEASRARAKQLYPFVDLKFKKDHNKAEAILIAEYGRLEENGNRRDGV